MSKLKSPNTANKDDNLILNFIGRMNAVCYTDIYHKL